MRRTRRAVLVLMFAVGAAMSGCGGDSGSGGSSGRGAPGDLDRSFGDGGIVTTAFGSETISEALAIGRDGKILAAGTAEGETSARLAVAQYDRRGRLERRFGAGGTVETAIDIGAVFADVAVQPDGNVVVAGISWDEQLLERFTVVRYLAADGGLDPTFGEGGIVTTRMRMNAEAHAVLLRSDGTIVVGGSVSVGIPIHFALARYRNDGTLDPQFGEGGVVTTGFESGPGVVASGAVAALHSQGDGTIVAAGIVFAGPFDSLQPPALALARYRPDGSLDPAFGVGGMSVSPIGTGPFTPALLLGFQPDGKIIVSRQDPGGTLLRFNADGTRDATFGSGGTVASELATPSAAATQADGKIVLVADSGGMLAVLRLEPSGAPDEAFGTHGRVTTFVPQGEFAFDVAVQDDGKIVVGGITEDRQFLLVRYLGGD